MRRWGQEFAIFLSKKIFEKESLYIYPILSAKEWMVSQIEPVCSTFTVNAAPTPSITAVPLTCLLVSLTLLYPPKCSLLFPDKLCFLLMTDDQQTLYHSVQSLCNRSLTPISFHIPVAGGQITLSSGIFVHAVPSLWNSFFPFLRVLLYHPIFWSEISNRFTKIDLYEIKKSFC